MTLEPGITGTILPPEPVKHSPILLWLDLETTGLDPQYSKVAEASCLCTDITGRTQIGPVFHQVFALELSDWSCVDEKVRIMHAKSNLLAETCEAPSEYVPWQWAREVAEFLEIIRPDPEVQPIVLAGSSVHFDRGFVKTYMPAIDKHLSYRHLDISAVRMALAALDGRWFTKWTGGNHRAREDMHASLSFYRRMLQAIGEGGAYRE